MSDWFHRRYPPLNYSVIEYGIVALMAYFFIVLEPMMLAQLGVLFMSVVIHEIAHGYTADVCGDETARQQGRLTLNPIRHVDPIGSILLPLMLILSGSGFLFGWAKPVPVNTFRLRDPVNDMVKVAIAGPLSNITIALFLSMLITIISGIFPSIVGSNRWVLDVMGYGVLINIVLAVFNLIPIPPMDGSRILYRWLSYSGRSFLDRIEPYGLVVILILAMLGVFTVILQVICVPIIRLLL